MRPSIEISEEGATATGEFRPDSGSDTFDFTLRENHPVNVTVSVSEEMTRYVSVYFVKKSDKQVVVEFARPYDFVHPGRSITYTLSEEETSLALFETVSGHYTLKLLPVDPSSPTSTSQQTEATGPYTITIEPIDTEDESPIDISTLLEMSTTSTPSPTNIATELLPEAETTTEAEPSNDHDGDELNSNAENDELVAALQATLDWPAIAAVETTAVASELDVNQATVLNRLQAAREDDDVPITGLRPGEQGGYVWWLTDAECY
jgi:hypothetical protein